MEEEWRSTCRTDDTVGKKTVRMLVTLVKIILLSLNKNSEIYENIM
jgi:hypothetical protein